MSHVPFRSIVLMSVPGDPCPLRSSAMRNIPPGLAWGLHRAGCEEGDQGEREIDQVFRIPGRFHELLLDVMACGASSDSFTANGGVRRGG